MNASNRFTRRLAAAVVVAFGLAASAAYASPPDPAIADSGQQLGSTALIVQQFDTGQQHVAATAVIIQKATDLGIVNYARILDTSPQHETVPAALVITPVANVDANAGTTPPIDTSPQLATVIAATIVNSTIGIVANTARIKELDTSPPVTRTASQLIGALGIDNTDTGQPATFAGHQVLALGA